MEGAALKMPSGTTRDLVAEVRDSLITGGKPSIPKLSLPMLSAEGRRQSDLQVRKELEGSIADIPTR